MTDYRDWADRERKEARENDSVGGACAHPEDYRTVNRCGYDAAYCHNCNKVLTHTELARP